MVGVEAEVGLLDEAVQLRGQQVLERHGLSQLLLAGSAGGHGLWRNHAIDSASGHNRPHVAPSFPASWPRRVTCVHTSSRSFSAAATLASTTARRFSSSSPLHPSPTRHTVSVLCSSTVELQPLPTAYLLCMLSSLSMTVSRFLCSASPCRTESFSFRSRLEHSATCAPAKLQALPPPLLPFGESTASTDLTVQPRLKCLDAVNQRRLIPY